MLSYTLCVMRRLGAPGWVRLTALLLYAFSPCYAGWATVIAKDTMFQIPFLLMVTLLWEFAREREAFFESWRRPALLGLSFLVMALSRHNGLPLAAAVLAVMLMMVLRRRERRRAAARLLACGALSLVLAVGVEAAISAALGIRDATCRMFCPCPFSRRRGW